MLRVTLAMALILSVVTPAAARPENSPSAPGGALVVEEVAVAVPPVDEDGDPAPTPRPAESDDVDLSVVADAVVEEQVQTDVVESAGFQLVGLTWPVDADVDTLAAQVRTRADGQWSEWVDLEPSDDGADAGTADAESAVRGGSEPIWVGQADAVQARFAATEAGGPAGLEVVLVDPERDGGASSEGPTVSEAPSAEASPSQTVEPAAAGRSVSGNSPSRATASSRVSTAREATTPLPAAVARPTIITRAQWGADESLRYVNAGCGTPEYASSLVGAAIHHTATSNAYGSVDEAKAALRSIYAYHVRSRGWCDIGYNFLVDKWGNVYEGRHGGVDQPVIGVHAGGFNTGTVGISMLGDYSAVTPPAATVEAVSRVVAWRLEANHRDPTEVMSYYTRGGENSKVPAGATVALHRVFPHRDVAYTACPGQSGYEKLTGIRSRARELIGAALFDPSISASSVPRGSELVVRARTAGSYDWRLEVRDQRTGATIWARSGMTPDGSIEVAWPTTNAEGAVVGAGPYLATLTATDRASGGQALPFSAAFEVAGSENPPAVASVSLGADLEFVPIEPTRLLDTRNGSVSLGPQSRRDVVVAGIAGIPADARAVALNVTATHASSATHIKAWPAGRPVPGTSVLNVDPSRTAAAGVLIGVGGEGKVSLYNDSGSVNLIVDVTGYFTSDAGAGQAFQPLVTATRVLDSRVTGSPFAPGERRSVVVAGSGVPADARAVVVNVTSVGSRAPGYVSVFPSGSPTPPTSTVNHLPGQDVANRATVAVTNGRVDVLVVAGEAHVVMDVVGWYGPGASTTFTPIDPVRSFDTRADGGPIGAGASRTFGVRAAAGLPSSAQVAAITLTATQQTALATHLTVWPAGGPQPGTSDLNTGAGRDQANLAVLVLGTGGSVTAYNNQGSVQLIGDVTGFFG